MYCQINYTTMDKSQYNYITKDVHISTIQGCDTVIHNGEMKTVCFNNIKQGGFFGTSLFGDSYNMGTKLVTKVIFV